MAEANQDTSNNSCVEEAAFKQCTHWSNHSFFKLFHTGVFSDCKIVCGDHVFNGHICVLASACQYFKKAFCGGFKESTDKTLNLSEENWITVYALLKYVYGCAFDQIFEEESIEDTISTYALAERFGYPKLRDDLVKRPSGSHSAY
ncbi:hypothetical protein CAC42_5725 [Sphaceloma murrayae]|uniref:BTB domain-containing protein n=1 Tax=Sphaceloma murrayae TaxID=2082308 RepID=A0A2K1QYZ5_9PEZI|nr:hypothetical protein CAC42_5725 [Sphaceloma murrayae]